MGELFAISVGSYPPKLPIFVLNYDVCFQKYRVFIISGILGILKLFCEKCKINMRSRQYNDNIIVLFIGSVKESEKIQKAKALSSI